MKKKNDEHENHERWLVSYADFITLLFAFFVVMYATSTQNDEKERSFEKSIRKQFGLIGMTGGSQSHMGAGPKGQIFDPLELLQRRDVGNEELEENIVKLIQKNLSQQEREASIERVELDPLGVRITLAASSIFPSGSAKIKSPALSILKKVGEIVKASNRSVMIEGHTDDQPVGGGLFETNWELASVRATTVVRYLINVHQVDPRKVAAISYGDQRPLVDNSSEKNRARNRRIEILIVNRGEE